MPNTRPLSSLISAALLLACVPSLARPESPAAAAIRPAAIKTHVDFLASDALAGRASGSKGNEEAARYVAAAFRRAGLKPVGTDRLGDAAAKMDGRGYFQPFTFTAGVAKGAHNALQAVLPGGKQAKYHLGTEFEPHGISSTGRASAEVVFAGYGIQSKEPARDDFAGLEVKGRIVMILAGAPGNDPHSPLMEFAGLRRKVVTARDLGAAAIVLVLPRASDIPRAEAEQTASDAGLPVVTVRRSVAEAWVSAAGKSLDALEQSLTAGASAFPTGVRAAVETEVRKVRKTTANVLGLLEGADPALKNEVVVIGAHMDHLGMGGPGSLAEDHKPAIHHGADDNASGTAGVLALADYFTQSAARPRRSILFICFSGEELGLLGSRHYVKNPVIPNARTAAMLNMDMIGRMQNDRLIVIGSGTSTAWNGLLDEVNRSAGFTLSRSESGFGASDQQSFYTERVPVLFFFTGLHADYHKPTDTADKINVDGEARVVDFVAQCARRIADSSERPVYQRIAQVDSQPARFRVSLGTIPDYAAEVVGVLLSDVRPGSPADMAGMKKGDILVKFGDRTIRNVQEFTVALGERKPGDVVEIVVRRGSERVTLKATLAASHR